MRNKPKLSDDLLSQVSAINPETKKQVNEENTQSRTVRMPLRSDDPNKILEQRDVTKGK